MYLGNVTYGGQFNAVQIKLRMKVGSIDAESLLMRNQNCVALIMALAQYARNFGDKRY